MVLTLDWLLLFTHFHCYLQKLWPTVSGTFGAETRRIRPDDRPQLHDALYDLRVHPVAFHEQPWQQIEPGALAEVEDLVELRDAIIELYLAIKIRSTDEVS